MGALALETESVCSSDYVTLGLKDSSKDHLGKPQVLSLLSTFLERSVQKNERMLETTQIKDVITIFHGLRAPSLSIQQLLITSVMVAAKFMDDSFFNNAYYARVGGVSTAELNKLEKKFLFCLDFRLYVSVQTFGKYCSLLKKEAAGGLIERPIQACGVKDSWGNKDSSSCTQSIAIQSIASRK